MMILKIMAQTKNFLNDRYKSSDIYFGSICSKVHVMLLFVMHYTKGH